MKRYRVLSFSFDARANILSINIDDKWESKIKEQWIQNQKSIESSYINEFGNLNWEQKKQNLTDIGAAPVSIIAFHNVFFEQIRNAFIIGAYYPSLVGTCSLGERILNQLILHLRDDFKTSSQYKRIYKKDSFDGWDLAINTLDDWGVLLPKPVHWFKELKVIRHQSVHFNPELDRDERTKALEAIRKLTEIINEQFSAFGNLPWYIPNNSGASFIKKEYETEPFVQRIVLPNCAYVGYKHILKVVNNSWHVIDYTEGENIDMSDEAFVEAYKIFINGWEQKKVTDNETK